MRAPILVPLCTLMLVAGCGGRKEMQPPAATSPPAGAQQPTLPPAPGNTAQVPIPPPLEEATPPGKPAPAPVRPPDSAEPPPDMPRPELLVRPAQPRTAKGRARPEPERVAIGDMTDASQMHEQVRRTTFPCGHKGGWFLRDKPGWRWWCAKGHEFFVDDQGRWSAIKQPKAAAKP